jgi:hypothetical protein
MKGQILECEMGEAMEMLRGNSETGRRIFVPDANNLAITPWGSEVFAIEGYIPDEFHRKIDDVEVPDELIDRAREYVRAQLELRALNGMATRLVGQ